MLSLLSLTVTMGGLLEAEAATVIIQLKPEVHKGLLPTPVPMHAASHLLPHLRCSSALDLHQARQEGSGGSTSGSRLCVSRGPDGPL